MSWQDDAMAEQDCADTLAHMGEAEWRDMYDDVSPDYEYEIRKCNKTTEEAEKIIEEGVENIIKKAKRAEYNKRWREKHPEQTKKINRENAANWRAKNRDRYNKYMSEYRKRKGEKGSEVQNS